MAGCIEGKTDEIFFALSLSSSAFSTNQFCLNTPSTSTAIYSQSIDDKNLFLDTFICKLKYIENGVVVICKKNKLKK